MRPAAFRGRNSTPGANHPLKANEGGKLSILSQATCLRCFGEYEGRLSPGRTVLLAPSIARPRPAAPPLRRAPWPDPLVICSSFGFARSIFDWNRISLVRASGESLGRLFYDALESTRNPCPLGEKLCWHPVLPDAPLLRRALRPDPLVVCPGFRLDKPGIRPGNKLPSYRPKYRKHIGWTTHQNGPHFSYKACPWVRRRNNFFGSR